MSDAEVSAWGVGQEQQVEEVWVGLLLLLLLSKLCPQISSLALWSSICLEQHMGPLSWLWGGEWVKAA